LTGHEAAKRGDGPLFQSLSKSQDVVRQLFPRLIEVPDEALTRAAIQWIKDHGCALDSLRRLFVFATDLGKKKFEKKS
jgi:hypothetical protein